MKIQIIGYSGSGKSTLAKILAEHYKLNLLYLDNVKHYGNWQKRTKEETTSIVWDFIKAHNDWVIDGVYLSLVPERFEICDLIIFLDYNRFYCYKKAKERFKQEKEGGSRESCQCPPKFDWEFKKWLLFKGRNRKRKRNLETIFTQFKGEKKRFKNVKELEIYLSKLK